MKNNYAGIAAPTTSDDVLAGYAVGSRWINILTGVEYICTSGVVSQATWAITGALGASKTFLPFLSIEDISAGVAKALDYRYQAVSMLNAA